MPERQKTNSKAILLTFVLGASLACRAESAPAEPEPMHTNGSEHQLPEPQEYAHRLDDDSRKTWQKPDEVIALLDSPSGGTVVDLGAGTGYFLQALSKAVGPKGRVLALDPDRAMVDRMRIRVERDSLQNVRPELISTDDPNLDPRSVDRILVVNTWHHIEGRSGYARKLKESLQPGGMVLIVDFTLESPIGPPDSMRLTIDTVRSELEAAGLTAEVLEESLPYQYAIAGQLP